MKATIHEVQKKNYTWIVAIVLLVLPIVVEFIWGETLYNKTHNDIENAQKFMYKITNLKIFDNFEEKLVKNFSQNNNTNTSEELYSYFNSFLDESSNKEESKTTEIFFTEFIHVINSNAFYILLCSFLYNFMNIYKIFILYMTIFLANLVSASLSYIFQFPKPYMAFYKIKSIIFFNEWGSPNNQLVLLIAFSGTFYKTLAANKLCEKKIWVKIIIIILLVFYVFIDAFLLFASGNLTYNQLILSTFLAVVIFLFIFFCFPIDLNKPKQFYDFMKFNIIYWIVINLLILAFQILLSIFITDRRDTQYYDDNITIQAKRLPQNSFVEGYCKYRTLFTLNSGNLCNVCSFLMNIVAFLSVKFEIKKIYNGTYNSWSENNFENSKMAGGLVDGDQSGMVEYNNIEQTQWNHNKWTIVLLRVLLDIVFNAVIFIFFIWVTHFTSEEIILFIFLIIFPMILCIFGNIYLFKAIFIRINLARPPKIKMKNLLY